MISFRRGFAAAIRRVADGPPDADAEQRRHEDADGQEHPRPAGRQLVQVLGVVAGRHQADGVQGQRRRQRAEQRREQDQAEAQRQLAVGVLRPGGRRAGDRHRGDQGQADQDVLHLVGVVPARHHPRHAEDEGDRDQQVGRQAGAAGAAGRGAWPGPCARSTPSPALSSSEASISIEQADPRLRPEQGDLARPRRPGSAGRAPGSRPRRRRSRSCSQRKCSWTKCDSRAVGPS